MNWLAILCVSLFPFITLQNDSGSLYRTSTGEITFISEAPLETITATSEVVKGIIDTTSRSFAFTVALKTFNGFNSKLQQEHFNENYMESTKFPNATFTGKIIENINFTQSGTIPVRAKGVLTIHGVKHERLIKAQIEIKDNNIYIDSNFIIALKDHDISIPKIVQQKISPEIDVTVKVVLKPTISE